MVESPLPGSSNTFFIKTRSGKMGVLQLIGFAPTIVVRAKYPGASPKVIEETVARPIEQEIRGVENLANLSSRSGDDGVMEMTVTFKPGTDESNAQALVQNRVSKAQAKLPEVVRSRVTTVKASPDLKNALGVNIRYKLLHNDKSDSRLEDNATDQSSEAASTGVDAGARSRTTPSPVPANVIVPSDFQAILPDGGRVTLLGCCENPSLTHSWWSPKGILLQTRPYDSLNASVVPMPGFVAREFAVQLESAAADASADWVFDPAASTAGGAAPTKGGSNVNNLRAIAAEIPGDARTVDVRFGIANGDWRSVAEKTIGPNGDGTTAAGKSGGSVLFAPSTKTVDQLQQLVSHDISGRAVRLVLVNQRGKTFLPVRTTSGSAGNLQQLQATFNTAAMEDVHRVELQVRDYHWLGE
jgi:hypothetical protein